MATNPRDAFIEACVWYGPLEPAAAILAEHPEIAGSDIYTAALLGDDAAVRRFLAADPGSATAKGGPRGWDALTYLCFSKYLRLDRSRTAGFVRAATSLLDAGASANTGFWELDHQPKPEWESVIYGAAGVAFHPEMTRLLLGRGAEPNDEETPYHSPESYDNAALQVLVESGKLTADSLAMMLVRKADWHDLDGIRYLLEHGADPNRMTRWHVTPFHHALRRDNRLANIEAMLDHGADATLPRGDGRSAIAVAARRGRADVLAALDRRGIATELAGVDSLIAACARNDAERAPAIAENHPELLRQLIEEGGTVLAEFAGTGNTPGVRCLLDLGIDPRALYAEGDGYFGIARNSTALHVAAWHAMHSTVKLLIERGTPVDALDGRGRTALALAVLACVDSYWTNRRSPESVEALLGAGASLTGVKFPSGYAEVDELLRAAT
ncbi:MAG TPA: ankyrin repeat domain-containing protein [Candidatus Solibacter sp.]|jgi:ankyrin repeat protein